MSENNNEETTLAMTYAYVALVKTLKRSGNLEMASLFASLNEAADRLERTGRDNASKFLRTVLNEQLRDI